MVKHFGMVAATVLGMMVTGSPAWAMSVGYVDTARLLTSYQGARSAQAEMQKELMAYQQAFQDRQRKVAEAQKAGKPATELQQMTEKFEKELAPLKARAAKLEQRLSGDVKRQVEAKIQFIAKAKKLDLVLDKAACLYGGQDITDEVIRALR